MMPSIKKNEEEDDNDENSEIPFLQRIEIKVKSIIFGVLYCMLEEGSNTIVKYVIFLIIAYIQMWATFVDPDSKFPWKSPTFEYYFFTILDFTSISNWSSKLPYIGYIIVFYLGILSLILVLADIAFVSYSFSKKKFLCVWPLTLLRSVCGLFISILFMPLLGIIN